MKNEQKIRAEVERAKRLLEEAMDILMTNIGQDYRIDEDILEEIDRDMEEYLLEEEE